MECWGSIVVCRHLTVSCNLGILHDVNRATVICSYFDVRCHVGKCRWWATSSFSDHCIVEFFLLCMGVGTFLIRILHSPLSSPSWVNYSVQKAQLVSLCCCVVNMFSHTNPSASLWHHQACGGEGSVPLTQSHWKYVYFSYQCSVSCVKEGWRDGEAPLHDCLLMPYHPNVKLFQVAASDRCLAGLAFESLSLLIMRIASLVAVLVGGRF